MKSRKEIGEKLKGIRESNGVSKYLLYQGSTKINKSAIDRIEVGKENYTVDSLLDYCNVLGVEIDLK